jgi:hypothetical protein
MTNQTARRNGKALSFENEIRSEIYRAFELLSADSGLLATVGSWGDTLDDLEVLRLLKQWNAGPH